MDAELLRRHWFAACPLDEIPAVRPVGRTICGTPVVLFRGAQGKIAALVDRCPHRNAPLSQGKITQGHVQCPYHGWEFDGDGNCAGIPGLVGKRPCEIKATAIPVQEEGGFAWLCVGGDPHPFRAPPPLPTDRSWDRLNWTVEAECELVDGLENLLDACHPHFAHAGWVRTSGKRRTVRVALRRTQDRVEATYLEESRAAGLIPRLLEGDRSASIGRYFPPGTAQLEYRGPKGVRFILTSMFAPAEAGRVRVYSVIATPRGKVPAFAKHIMLRALFRRILKQDQAVLSAQSRNMARFDGARFASTSLDVMRPHILFFLRGESEQRSAAFETRLEMEL